MENLLIQYGQEAEASFKDFLLRTCFQDRCRQTGSVPVRVNLKISAQVNMPLTSKEMIRLLRKNGFEIVSQSGSHVKLKNPKNGRQVIVPYHAKELKKGLEQSILKQAGLK